MTKNNYDQELKNPRWQKRRLEKMQQAGWKCEICGDDKEELNVHHPEYNGRQAWEYTLSDLECLCKTCHSITHMDPDKVKAHAKRLCVNYKTIRFIERPLRLVPNTIPSWCDEAGILALLKLQYDVRREYRAFEQSIKDRRDSIWKSIIERVKSQKSDPNAQLK